jgi:hypothetical protein
MYSYVGVVGAAARFDSQKRETRFERATLGFETANWRTKRIYFRLLVDV